ncbi:MAG: cytochrome c3 family protein, partial [Planctomycetota bacterium]
MSDETNTPGNSPGPTGPADDQPRNAFSEDAAAVSPRTTKRIVFPRWANFLLPFIIINVLGGALYVPTFAGLALTPETLNIGYAPEQPVPYSHALHVGQLGMDCRYCHTTVDQAGFAAV